MSFFSFFVALAATLPARVCIALGVGWVSYAGYKTLLDQFVTDAVLQYNYLPADLYNLFGLAGFTDGFGIILGAFSAKAAIFGVRMLGSYQA